MKHAYFQRIFLVLTLAAVLFAGSLTVYARESSGIELSAEEQAYIEKKKVMKVAVAYDLRPIISVGDGKGEFQGLAIDILHFLESETGLKIELVEAGSYWEAARLVENGSADVTAMTVNYQRTGPSDQLEVSEPYLESVLVMIHNKKVELGGRSSLDVAQVEGYPVISSRASITYMDFASPDDCLMAVRSGHADVMYCNVFSALDYMQRFENRELTMIPLDIVVQFRFGISSEADAELKELLNHTIASINRENINQSLTYGRTKSGDSLGDFVYYYPFEIICTILAAAFLVCLATILHTRTKKHLAVSLQGFEASYRTLADTVGGIGFNYDCTDDTLTIFGQHAGQLSIPTEIKDFSAYMTKPDKEISLSPEQLEQMLKEGMAGEAYDTELECKMSDGEWLHFRLTFSILATNEAYQRPIRLIGYLSNVEGAYQEKKSLLQLSRLDKLSGLCNRAGAEAELTKYIASGADPKKDVIMMIDVDHFKAFNDTYGHDCGDDVLATIGRHFQHIFRQHDILCRWGGDEFFLYLFGAADYIELIKERCQLLKAALNTYQYEGDEIPVTLSMGGAVIAERSLEEAFKLADQALYTVKKSGRDSICILSD